MSTTSFSALRRALIASWNDVVTAIDEEPFTLPTVLAEHRAIIVQLLEYQPSMVELPMSSASCLIPLLDPLPESVLLFLASKYRYENVD